jgi:uncharacterized repeat protein (TIGR02543 family)
MKLGQVLGRRCLVLVSLLLLSSITASRLTVVARSTTETVSPALSEETAGVDEPIEMKAHGLSLSDYTLTVQVVGEGTVVVDPNKDSYNHGDEVTLTAIPEPGWFFGGWVFQGSDGETTGILLEIVGMMYSDVIVTASFVEIPEGHNVLAVWVEPFGMATTNPAAGHSTHPADTEVTITVTPLAGWRLDHWSGACEGTGECIVTLDNDKSVVAHFARDEYTLTVTIIGNGTVDVDPDKETYTYGELVTVTATPDPGWVFAGWDGDPTATLTQIVGRIESDIALLATFTQIPEGLSMLTIAVDPVTGGTTSPAAGTHTYADGTVVDITATPTAGWRFVSWTGACTGTDACTVTMDGDKTVTAHFVVSELPHRIHLPFTMRNHTVEP